MKIFGFAFAVALVAGCNSNGLDSNNGNPIGNNNPDGSPSNYDMAYPVGIDLAEPPGGPVGSTCKTACDCMPGLACDPRNNTCTMPPTQIGPVYCCDDTSNCPSGSICQSRAGGNYGMCGTTSSGGCKTACDCTPGEACFNGNCQSGFQAVYCCDDPATCVSGVCQSSTGQLGMCGGGVSDLGAVTCSAIPCTRNRTCTTAGCGMCNPMTHFCQ